MYFVILLLVVNTQRRYQMGYQPQNRMPLEIADQAAVTPFHSTLNRLGSGACHLPPPPEQPGWSSNYTKYSMKQVCFCIRYIRLLVSDVSCATQSMPTAPRVCVVCCLSHDQRRTARKGSTSRPPKSINSVCDVRSSVPLSSASYRRMRLTSY